MKVKQYCSAVFPGVPWTGGGSIHASLADSHMIKEVSDKEVIRYLITEKIGRQYWYELQEHFEKMEFFVSESEFNALFMIDAVRHLKGYGDSASEKEKLKNPTTGNVFHQIAVYKDLIGGIRFWCDRPHGHDGAGMGVHIGFRFRLQKLVTDKDMEKQTTQEKVAESVKEYEKLTNTIQGYVEIDEPQVITEPDIAEPLEIQEPDIGEP